MQKLFVVLVSVMFLCACREQETPTPSTNIGSNGPSGPPCEQFNLSRYSGNFIGTTSILRYDTLTMDTTITTHSDTCHLSRVCANGDILMVGGIGFNTFAGVDTTTHQFTFDSFDNMDGYYTNIGSQNPIVDFTIQDVDSADFKLSWIFHGQRQ